MVPTNVLHNVQVSSPSNAQLNPQPVLESSTASVPHAASPETLLASVPPSLLPILQTAAQNIAQQFYLDSERFPIPAFQIARTGGGIPLSPMPSLSLTSNGNSQNDVPHAGNFQTQANANDSTPTLAVSNSAIQNPLSTFIATLPLATRVPEDTESIASSLPDGLGITLIQERMAYSAESEEQNRDLRQRVAQLEQAQAHARLLEAQLRKELTEAQQALATERLANANFQQRLQLENQRLAAAVTEAQEARAKEARELNARIQAEQTLAAERTGNQQLLAQYKSQYESVLENLRNEQQRHLATSVYWQARTAPHQEYTGVVAIKS